MNKTCMDQICNLKGLVGTAVVGVKEPEYFAEEKVGEEKLKKAGVKYLYIEGLEEEILKITK